MRQKTVFVNFIETLFVFNKPGMGLGLFESFVFLRGQGRSDFLALGYRLID